MARGIYHVMREEDHSTESIFECTRVADTERYFHRLYQSFMKSPGFCVQLINLGYFAVEQVYDGMILRTEYWIEKRTKNDK